MMRIRVKNHHEDGPLQKEIYDAMTEHLSSQESFTSTAYIRLKGFIYLTPPLLKRSEHPMHNENIRPSAVNFHWTENRVFP